MSGKITSEILGLAALSIEGEYPSHGYRTPTEPVKITSRMVAGTSALQERFVAERAAPL